MQQASSEVVFSILKNTSKYSKVNHRKCFNGGTNFSSEPLNISNLNTLRHSQLANDRVLNVFVDRKGNLDLVTTKGEFKNKPSLFNKHNHLKRRGYNQRAKFAFKLVVRKGYKPEVRRHLLVRISKLQHALVQKRRHARSAKRVKKVGK